MLLELTATNRNKAKSEDHSAPLIPGLGATIIRNTPANGVYLGTFEVLKRKAAASYNVPVTEVPAWVILGSAGFGGLAYWVIIFPVDVVKSAMMTDSLDPAKRRFKTMASTIPVSNGEKMKQK